jgi:5-methylcytosine-specific restriction protein A
VPRAPKQCSHPNCPNSQPCPTHQRKPWEGSTRKQTLPPSREWERIRRRVIDRDPICKLCNAAVSVEVDHIHNRNDHSLPNLQGVCRRCHRAKTLAEATAARTQGGTPRPS